MAVRGIKYRARVAKVEVPPSLLDEKKIINAYLANVQTAFDSKIGPHWQASTRAKTPVGEREATSKGKVNLVTATGLGDRQSAENRFRRAELESLLSEARGSTRLDILKSSDVQFFRGAKGRNKGQIPTSIDVKRGSLIGTFTHKPGTLRDSVRYVGSKRVGNAIVATLRAHAPYAMARHQGFTQRAGSPPNQKAGKRIPGVPFLRMGFAAIKEELVNPKTYRG